MVQQVKVHRPAFSVSRPQPSGLNVLFYVTLSLVVFTRSQRCAVAAQPIVETPLGSVAGQHVPLENGDVINAFLGIPFATPPVDELRFEVYKVTLTRNPVNVQQKL